MELHPRREIEAKPLRIAMVAPPFYEIPPTAYGGIEAVLALLVDAASEIACSTSSMPEPHLGTRTRKPSSRTHSGHPKRSPRWHRSRSDRVGWAGLEPATEGL